MNSILGFAQLLEFTELTEAQHKNLQYILKSGNHLLQLINEVLDIAGVTNKFGLPPERIVDYLMLIGDTSDNVPGVEKVGPKTAVKWLQQYGTLENIIQHADEITGVVGENLRKALSWLPTCRQLITIKCDCALKETWQDPEPKPFNRDKLIQLFEHFEFKTLVS